MPSATNPLDGVRTYLEGWEASDRWSRESSGGGSSYTTFGGMRQTPPAEWSPTASPGTIQVTERAHARLASTFQFEERGVIEVKGKGPMRTYLMTGARSATSSCAQVSRSNLR